MAAGGFERQARSDTHDNREHRHTPSKRLRGTSDHPENWGISGGTVDRKVVPTDRWMETPAGACSTTGEKQV